MRKLIISLILVFTMCGNAFAILPALGIGLGALIAGATHLAGIYFYLKQSSAGDQIVDAHGDVYRKSAVTYIDLTADVPPKPVVVVKDVTAKIPLKEMRDLAKADPGKYPEVLGATTKGGLKPIPNGPTINGTKPAGMPITGDFVMANGAPQLVGECFDGSAWWSPPPAEPLISPSSFRAFWGGPTYNGQPMTDRFTQCTFSPVDVPPVQNKTEAEARASLLDGSPDDKISNPLLKAELDKMLADGDYVPTFTDDSTGLPYAPPPGLPSQAQLDAADRAAATAAAAAAANTQALASATAAAAAADAAASSAAAAAAASPGDPVLAQKAADAAAAAGAAHATADGLAAQQATQAAQEAKDESTPFTGTVDPSAYGGGQSFDFGARFQSFITAMKATALFSIPGQFLSNVPSGGSSTISFDGGRFGAHTFDFASLSAVFLAVRGLVMVCFTWLAVKIVTLKGGSA